MVDHLIHPASNGGLSKRLAGLAALGLTILLAIMLAQLFWMIFTPASQPEAISTAPVTETETGSLPVSRNYGESLAKQHLFGVEEKRSTPTTKPKPQTKPATRLNLALAGIVAKDAQNRFAIISVNGGDQQIFTVGDEVQPDVTVDDIIQRKVIISRNGSLEELLLPELSAIKSSPGNLRNLPSASPQKQPRSGRRGQRSSPAASPPEEQNPYGEPLPMDDLSALRDAISNDPERMMEIANASEATDKDGNFIGFRLSPGKNRALFRKLKLRTGDIVTSVNGITMDSPAKGIAVMSELQGASTINLTVKRGNQEVTISETF